MRHINRYDYLDRRSRVEYALNLPTGSFEKLIIKLYKDQKLSGQDIANLLFKETKQVFTARTIQRIAVKHNIARTGADGFRIKVELGEVNFRTKPIKARKNNIGNPKRYAVLKRDGFKCVLCGATAKDDYLDVDHIIAITNGGSDELDNLRCLCQSCNIGKRIVEKEV